MKLFKQIHLSDSLTKGEHLAKQQIIRAQSITEQTNMNIVTCGDCGEINIINTNEDTHHCYLCEYEGEGGDFPDLFYNGMSIERDKVEEARKEALEYNKELDELKRKLNLLVYDEYHGHIYESDEVKEGFESLHKAIDSIKMDLSANIEVLTANDADGNELNEGDKVVVLDGEGLDIPLPRGTVLYINQILDHESNYIEFDIPSTTHAFYGDRVLKLDTSNL